VPYRGDEVDVAGVNGDDGLVLCDPAVELITRDVVD
jgi:hypothetical protein